MITVSLPARAGAALAVIAALAAGCSSPPEPPQAEAAIWLAAHPVPPQPGWVAAMILPGGFADVGFIGAAARQACPGMRLADGTVVAAYRAGDLPGCGAWTAAALTVTGHVVSLACGSIPGRVECPLFRYANGYIPGGGDYVRIRAGGGQITGWDSIQVIEEFADLSPVLMEPDDGGPDFATTPAVRS